MTRARGWLPDPTRRHELRFWDGDAWTADVSDGGAVTFDPLEVPITPPPPDPADPIGSVDPVDPVDPAWPAGPEASPPGQGAGADYLHPQGRWTAVSETPVAEPPASASSATGAPGPATAPPDRPPDVRLPRPARSGPMATAGFPGQVDGPPPRRSPWGLVAGVVLVAAVAVAGYAVLRAGKSGDDQDANSSLAATSTITSDIGSTSGDDDEATSTTGGSGPTDVGELMVAAVAQGIVEGSEGAINEDQAVCMGQALIDEIGIDRLADITETTADEPGANPLDLLTEEERTAAMTRMRACVDQATLDSLSPGDG